MLASLAVFVVSLSRLLGSWRRTSSASTSGCRFCLFLLILLCCALAAGAVLVALAFLLVALSLKGAA